MLPRGVWKIDVPMPGVRVFLMVTSTGAVSVHRVPEVLFTHETVVLDALTDQLSRIDPRPCLQLDRPPKSNAAAIRRVLAEYGYQTVPGEPPA